MGDNVLILAFVVIVIGGMGSIRGAFVAALLIGIVDTIGRAFLRPTVLAVMSKASADNAGPAIASILIYVLMAMVLVVRPEGLFPAAWAQMSRCSPCENRHRPRCSSCSQLVPVYAAARKYFLLSCSPAS